MTADHLGRIPARDNLLASDNGRGLAGLPAARNSSRAGSHWNSMPMSRTIVGQPSSRTAIDSSDSTS